MSKVFKIAEGVINGLIERGDYDKAIQNADLNVEKLKGEECAVVFELRAIALSLQGKNDEAFSDAFTAGGLHREAKGPDGFFKYSQAASIVGDTLMQRGLWGNALDLLERALSSANNVSWEEKFVSKLNEIRLKEQEYKNKKKSHNPKSKARKRPESQVRKASK